MYLITFAVFCPPAAVTDDPSWLHQNYTVSGRRSRIRIAGLMTMLLGQPSKIAVAVAFACVWLSVI